MPTDTITAYLKQLSPKEKQAYQIAQSHLGSSFNLEKSIGFQKWIANKKSP